ncbi:MAG: right-handed parallel beta-helix repeat-containing protein [Planctomycetota bacterium]
MSPPISLALLAFPLAARPLGDERLVTADLILAPGEVLATPLVIAADGITIDGNGAVVRGPGKPGELATFQGIGIRLEGRRNVTIRNLAAHGFATGLAATDCEGLVIEGGDFSDNYHDPDYGWGDGERSGGLILTRVRASILRQNRANRVWNGLDLFECDENEIAGNDFSHCSNVCLKLWRSSRNRILANDLSWGLRISPGEVHARDSTSVLIESGSDENRFERNDATHGGDGIFIRPLNGWLSTGNVFVENDCSYANNNGFESWSPGNVFLRNKANHCSYGFWLGGSDATVLIGNEASFNGLPDGKHNAPESDFGHGGIVIVHGSGRHSLIDDNWCHDNAGGGIVLRGDLATRGAAWKMEHLVVQRNRLERNRWGIFVRFADRVFLAGNRFAGNEADEFLEEVANVRRGDGAGETAPEIALAGPGRAFVGDTVAFRASGPEGPPAAGPLRFSWDVGGAAYEDVAAVERVFPSPGFYRVSVTGTDGHLAGLAFRDLYVVSRASELATEGHAGEWGWTMGNDPEGRGAVLFADDPEAVEGERSIRLQPDPYSGWDVAAIFPAGRDAGWDLRAKTTLSFWLRFRNPNLAFDGPTIVRLHAAQSVFTYVPTTPDGRPVNLLRELPYPEGRAGWVRVEVPLAGGEGWLRTEGFAGEAPAHHDRDLAMETVATPMETGNITSLASAGGYLWCANLDGDRLWRSRDGRTWEERRGPGADLGSYGEWINGMLVAHGGGLLLRHRDPARDEDGVEWARLVRYDIAADRWTWLPTRIVAAHGAAVVGDRLFALAHALGANFGGPLARVDLADPPPHAERSALAGIAGADAGWLSRASQLAVLGGRIYGLKNDWQTPRPEAAESGDRLFAFDPAAFAPSEFAGGEPWRDESWRAAWTPVEDLGPLPFEVGHGAALVALPPRWCAGIGARGGLFLTAGCSPSDHEGFGPPSALYALWDAATGAFTTGALPAATGAATSACLHAGRLFVKRGGLGYGPFDAELWIVTPVAPERAAAARADLAARRPTLARIDWLALQLDSNGQEPFDVWIDGLRFE